MILHIGLLLVGLAVVAKGGDLFVDSSVEIARKLHIPRVVIGATIVSIATTVPELTVSTMASWMGDSGIAVGNAVGSCIANIGLVVGCVAVITAVSVDRADFKRRSVWLIIAAVLVIVFSWGLSLSRLQGTGLLAVALGYLVADYWNVRQQRVKASGVSQGAIPKAGKPKYSFGQAVGLFVLGILLVIGGSRLLVTSGIAVAQALGIPSILIGLTVVAVGTSLPELVTGVSAARKGVPDLSVGNIVGANVLNLALIVGLSAVIRPLSLDRWTQTYSFSWMALFIVLLILIFRRDQSISQREGFTFLLLYGAYVLGLIFLPAFMP